MEPSCFRFGDVEFDAESGVVRRRGGAGGSTRLAPQPARLLALIVRARGRLVTHEAIRRHVWPDVEIEFDKSLHFCIRQIRAALGDSASEASYIETLPKRGYRLRVSVEETAGRATAATRRRRSVRVLVPLLVVTAAFAFLGIRATSNVPALRIGIMPFEPVEGQESNGIAERILESLAHSLRGRAWVVGPTTTTSRGVGDGSIRALATAYDLDFVINGRFLDPPHGRMLAELIRATDGAHIWVERFEDVSDERDVADRIVAGVESRLTAP